MKRRGFFGGLAAVAAGMGLPRVAAAFDPTVPSRAADGGAICRNYREGANGVWMEIAISDIRPGDRIIRIGQDGRRLWLCDALTVREMVPPHADNAMAGGVIVEPQSEVIVLHPKWA